MLLESKWEVIQLLKLSFKFLCHNSEDHFTSIFTRISVPRAFACLLFVRFTHRALESSTVAVVQGNRKFLKHQKFWRNKGARKVTLSIHFETHFFLLLTFLSLLF